MPHKNRTAGALHILTLISIFFGSVQIAAQSPEAPTYRVQSELVLVDLLASDSAGNRITNLAKKDIEIREDGKKQKIEYFEFLTSRPPDRPQPWTSTEFASPNDQIRLVILVDLGSIRAQGWAQARKSLSQFLLNDLPKGSQVMLATFRTSLSILHPLSTDTQSIVGALEEIEAAVDPGATIATFDSFMKQLADSTRGAISTEDAASAASTTMRNFLDLLEGQMGRLTASLGAISQLLGPYPGRKQVALYSSGYPMQAYASLRSIVEKQLTGGRYIQGAEREQLNAILDSSKRVDMTPFVETAVDRANRSQVSIYAIDPRGLTGGVGANRDSLTSNSHTLLSRLSELTGGRAFYNRNDLEGGLRNVTEDVGSYYLLGYKPKHKKKKGRFHRIEVRLKLSGATARYRQGYLERDDVDVSSDEVMTAVKFWEVFQGDCQGRIAMEGGQMVVTTLIPTSLVRLRPEGEKHRGSIEIFGVLFDQDGKWIGEDVFFSTGQRLNFSATQYRNLPNFANVTLKARTNPPPPGTYDLIGVVRQSVDRSISTFSSSVTITPDGKLQ